MARIIASGLKGELGAILVHKIPAPNNEELAIGSVGLSGKIQILPYIEKLEIPKSYIESAAKKQLELLKTRQQNYGLHNPNYKDRIVIIIDDGIATGATALGAIYEVHLQKPKKIILAAGVIAKETAKKLRRVVDELVVLYEPEEFSAVGQFFSNFSQVSDEEVVEVLRKKDEK